MHTTRHGYARPYASHFGRSQTPPKTEDVADFVEPPLQATVKAAPMPRRQRNLAMLWLLGLLPLVALAVGATWAF